MTRNILGIFVIIIECTYLARGNFVCNNTDEFYFTAPQTNCVLYYRCRDGQRVNYLECPMGKMFDFTAQKCVERGLANSCEDPTCFGKIDGYHADNNCQRYFRCLSSQLVTFESCKRGFLFNGKICEPSENFRCDFIKHSKRSCNSNHHTDDCQFLNDGLYPDESSKDCKSYLKCSSGKTSHLRCPSSTVFNPIQGSCVPDVIYECPRSARLDKLCKGKSDGYHPDPRYGCNAFVKCLRGVPIQFDECGSGQFFDSSKKYCTFKSSVPCSHEARSSECMQLEMGFYQDRSLESSCRNYFFCFNGHKTLLTCPIGELFNGESCVDDRIYTCPNLDADSCDTKNDGYYKDNASCRSYFFCSSNRKFSFLCKSGEAFDGNKCVSKRHVETCTKSYDCAGKPNGYYQDVKSGCTKYFYCKQSEKLQVLTCRNGRVFNGNSCVSPQSYVCPNVGQQVAQKLNCIPRKCSLSACQRDGFFADYDSRCKNYYFCVNGNQSKLSCMKNFIFNENEGLCVPQDKYQCPVYCSSECS